MPDLWVLNASPVIVLAKVDGLRLIEALAGEVLLPVAVADEILSGPAGDPARAAMDRGWGRRVPSTLVPATVLEWGLGRGESAVLAFVAEHPGAIAVLDDAEGRSCARALGLPVLGTLGIILRARKRNLIPSAAGFIRSLQAAGLHLDEATIREALKRSVGEEW